MEPPLCLPLCCHNARYAHYVQRVQPSLMDVESPDFQNDPPGQKAREDKRSGEVACVVQSLLAECAINIVLEIAMPTRNVVLTDSQAKFVEQMVASGHYQNASEVLREGLRLVQAREAEQAAKLAALREAVAVGIADIEAGRYIEFKDATALDRYLTKIADQAINGA